MDNHLVDGVWSPGMDTYVETHTAYLSVTAWYIHCPYKCLTSVHTGQTVDIRISSEERSLSQPGFQSTSVLGIAQLTLYLLNKRSFHWGGNFIHWPDFERGSLTRARLRDEKRPHSRAQRGKDGQSSVVVITLGTKAMGVLCEPASNADYSSLETDMLLKSP